MTALASEGIKSELELLNHDVNSYDVGEDWLVANYKNVIISFPTWNVKS